MINNDYNIISSDEASDPFEGLSQEEISELLEAFVEDVFEKLDELCDLFFRLEKDPDKDTTINMILQIYHGIKSTGGTFGFPVVSTLAHNYETVFNRFLENTDLISKDNVSKLLKSIEYFKKLTDNIRAQKSTK
jgi:chemotaxis protein histidine kinase CheA